MSDGDNEDLAKIAGMPVETGRPVLTVALEVSSDKYGVRYRATFMGRTGAWRRAPRDAVESVFLAIDPWEVAQAVGVMPIMNAQTDRICGRCGTPMLSEMKSCPGCVDPVGIKAETAAELDADIVHHREEEPYNHELLGELFSAVGRLSQVCFDADLEASEIRSPAIRVAAIAVRIAEESDDE